MNVQELTTDMIMGSHAAKILVSKCLVDSGQELKRGAGYTQKARKKCVRQVRKAVSGCLWSAQEAEGSFFRQKSEAFLARTGSADLRVPLAPFMSRRLQQEQIKWESEARARGTKHLLDCMKKLLGPHVHMIGLEGLTRRPRSRRLR